MDIPMSLLVGEVLIAQRGTSHTKFIEVTEIHGIWANTKVWWEDLDGNVSNPGRSFQYRVAAIKNYERRNA